MGDWLLGNWLLTYDPDDDPQDMLTFKPGGEFVATDVATKRKVEGVYFLKPGNVLVKLMQNGQIVMSLNLTFGENRDKLYYKSMNTGNTAYYTKVD